MATLAVLLACHNRRVSTLACLDALYRCSLPEGISLSTVLVDDGSSDDTATAVRAAHPIVEVIQGDGTLFWNGGMRIAFDYALRKGFDYYLWLNDDTVLYPTTVKLLLDVATEASRDGRGPAIVVGSTRDQTGKPSYGGWRHLGPRISNTWELMDPGSRPRECDTLNGNCVLIPHAVAEVVGNLDYRFVHGLGDRDYGFRARRAGFRLLVMPGFAGQCERNPPAATSLGDDVSLLGPLRTVAGPKRLPPFAWAVYSWRHNGPLWPLLWAKPYVVALLQGLTSRLRSGKPSD